MSHVDHSGKRLRGSRVRRHELGTLEDPHDVILDDDVDVIADQSMRDAIPDRVHVHEGVECDPTAQPLRAPRQGANRQRPKDRAFIALKAPDRCFPRGPVAALIGQHHPRGQMLLKRVEGVEGLIRQRIALDVFDARFRLAFRPRAIGRIVAEQRPRDAAEICERRGNALATARALHATLPTRFE